MKYHYVMVMPWKNYHKFSDGDQPINSVQEQNLFRTI